MHLFILITAWEWRELEKEDQECVDDVDDHEEEEEDDNEEGRRRLFSLELSSSPLSLCVMLADMGWWCFFTSKPLVAYSIM